MLVRDNDISLSVEINRFETIVHTRTPSDTYSERGRERERDRRTDYSCVRQNRAACSRGE